MKNIISLVLALLIPLLGCASNSPLFYETRSAAYLQGMEEIEWVELSSPRRSQESARQTLEEAVDTGRDYLRVFTSDGDTVVVKDPTIREDIIYSMGEVVGGQVVVRENIALEDVIRWQAGHLPAELEEIVSGEAAKKEDLGTFFSLLGAAGIVALIASIDWHKHLCLDSC